jgi:hypothetical protein
LPVLNSRIQEDRFILQVSRRTRSAGALRSTAYIPRIVEL